MHRKAVSGELSHCRWEIADFCVRYDRFAEVEMIAFIIGLLTRYRIELPSTPEWDRKRYSKEELRAKLMYPTYALTYAPKSCPLVFVPRA